MSVSRLARVARVGYTEGMSTNTTTITVTPDQYVTLTEAVECMARMIDTSLGRQIGRSQTRIGGEPTARDVAIIRELTAQDEALTELARVLNEVE